MNRFLLGLMVLAAAGCGGGSGGGNDTSSPTAYVVATLTMPHVGPFGARVTPDGTKLFVPLFGDFGAAGPGSTVAVYDTATDTLITEITVGARPEDVDFTPDSKYAYVTNSDDATVSVINVATLAVIATIPIGLPFDPNTYNGTYPFGVSIRNGKAYVFTTGTNSDGSDENIVIIDANPASSTFNTKIGGITLTGAFTRGSFRPGANELVVPRGVAGNDYSATPEIAFFDTTSDTFLTSIQIQQAPGGFHGMEDIAVTPNGQYAYAPFYNFGTGAAEVFVIDLANRRFQDVITLGTGDISTHGVSMRPDGLLVAVTSWNTGKVSFIYTPTNTVVYEFPVGANPNEIAFTPDGRKAYVTNQNSQSITVIALPSSADVAVDAVRNASFVGKNGSPAQTDLESLAQALQPPDAGPALDALVVGTLEWSREGAVLIGDPKDLNASGAQLNNFAVPREGVIAK